MRQLLLIIAIAALVAVSCGGDDETSAAEFQIERDLFGETTDFSATGAAVDDGLLCPAGESVYLQTLYSETGIPETETTPPEQGDVMWVEVEFTCADDSGDFILRAEVTVDDEDLDAAIASGELSSGAPLTVLSGSGDYEDLVVDGVRQVQVATPGTVEDGVSDVYSGTLTNG